MWRALPDSREFGSWFGVKVEGTFAPGAHVRGAILHPGYEHVVLEITIERMEPERLFSWRWPARSKTAPSGAGGRLAGAVPVFAALGDETRLGLVARMCTGGPMSIARLTAGARVTRQAVTKHLHMLAGAGLGNGTRRSAG